MGYEILQFTEPEGHSSMVLTPLTPLFSNWCLKEENYFLLTDSLPSYKWTKQMDYFREAEKDGM